MMVNAPAKFWGYWTKVYQIFIKRRRAIGGVNAHVRVAIVPFTVECQRTE